MTTYEPNFLITFQLNEPYDEFLNWFKEKYPEFDWVQLGNAITPENYMYVEKNSLYDPKRIDDRDGYVYFHYVLEVISRQGPDINESIMKQQAKLAHRFMKDFHERGHTVAIDSPDVESFMKT